MKERLSHRTLTYMVILTEDVTLLLRNVTSMLVSFFLFSFLPNSKEFKEFREFLTSPRECWP